MADQGGGAGAWVCAEPEMQLNARDARGPVESSRAAFDSQAAHRSSAKRLGRVQGSRKGWKQESAPELSWAAAAATDERGVHRCRFRLRAW